MAAIGLLRSNRGTPKHNQRMVQRRGTGAQMGRVLPRLAPARQNPGRGDTETAKTGHTAKLKRRADLWGCGHGTPSKCRKVGKLGAKPYWWPFYLAIHKTPLFGKLRKALLVAVLTYRPESTPFGKVGQPSGLKWLKAGKHKKTR